MLPLLAATLLSCTSDVECKGDRVCVAGECTAPTDAPEASAEDLARAQRVELVTRELNDRRQELKETNYAPPIIKLGFAAIFGVLSGVLFSAYGPANSCVASGLDNCFSPSLFLGGGIILAVSAVAMVAWGALQLHFVADAKRRLPDEISARESELRGLK